MDFSLCWTLIFKRLLPSISWGNLLLDQVTCNFTFRLKYVIYICIVLISWTIMFIKFDLCICLIPDLNCLSWLQPNCYSRVISVNSDEHIIIFAKRDIKRWEELTYDYRLSLILAVLVVSIFVPQVLTFSFILQIFFNWWTTCMLLWFSEMPGGG